MEFAALTSQHRVGHTGIPLAESLSFSFLVQHHKVILLFLGSTSQNFVSSTVMGNHESLS